MSVVAVIPARWGSRRFPGKAVVPILGRPMIDWVVAAARAARRPDLVLVATDDDRIAAAAHRSRRTNAPAPRHARSLPLRLPRLGRFSALLRSGAPQRPAQQRRKHNASERAK
jgi:hypothetical protein